MLMTARAASLLLGRLGLSRRHADAVLAAGLAGEPEVTSAALLYDRDAVDALLARPRVDDGVLATVGPPGLFVARRPGSVEAIASGWPMSPYTAVELVVGAQRRGFVPLVATLGGFVTLGAEILDVQPEPGSTNLRPSRRLTLRPAGEWFEAYRERRLPTGPGRPWALLRGGQSRVGE
jgi:hypothetical protein